MRTWYYDLLSYKDRDRREWWRSLTETAVFTLFSEGVLPGVIRSSQIYRNFITQYYGVWQITSSRTCQPFREKLHFLRFTKMQPHHSSQAGFRAGSHCQFRMSEISRNLSFNNYPTPTVWNVTEERYRKRIINLRHAITPAIRGESSAVSVEVCHYSWSLTTSIIFIDQIYRSLHTSLNTSLFNRSTSISKSHWVLKPSEMKVSIKRSKRATLYFLEPCRPVGCCYSSYSRAKRSKEPTKSR